MLDRLDLAPATQELLTAAFVSFFVILNGLGVAPIFAGLTEGASAARRSAMAVKSVLVAGVILLGFAFGGPWLLATLGVSLDAFRLGGGVLLFLLALDMLFETQTERRKSRADAILAENGDTPDVSVFPIGIPMLAGPGSIATIMLFMGKAEAVPLGAPVVIAALGANLSLCLVFLLGAGVVLRLVGDTLAAMLTRILGVILAALAAQFVIDGARNAFGLG